MDLQNLLPHQTQPIQRTTTGQLPTELTELREEALSDGSIVPTIVCADGVTCGCGWCGCSYDGDDAE